MVPSWSGFFQKHGNGHNERFGGSHGVSCNKRTVATSRQFFPVRPSSLVIKRLSTLYLVDVLIVNRYEHYERLNNFDVRVGVSTDNLQNPTCHDRVGTVGQGQFLSVQCDPPIPGRYVSVQMFGEGYLTLCEVFVYSRVGE